MTFCTAVSGSAILYSMRFATLRPISRAELATAPSDYLAWIDLNPLSIEPYRLQKILIEEQKVAIMPGDTDGQQGEGYIRLNVGCPRSKVDDGLAQLIAGITHCRAVRLK